MLRNLFRTIGPAMAGLVAVSTIACGATRHGADGAEPVPSDTGTRIYVANQASATVTVIDIASRSAVATVDLQALGFGAEAKPHHVAVEPDGSYWYLSLIAENRVLKFDRDNNLVGQVEFERPGMLVLDPDSDNLLVGRSMAAVNPPQRVGLIARSEMELDEIDVFFPRPHAIAIHPSGRYFYAASLAVNQMAAYDLESGQLELIDVPGSTHTFVQFAISPDGGTLIATGQLTGQLLIFDNANPAKPEYRGSVALGHQPWHPVITPDGARLYVGNKDDNTVSVVDLASRTVMAVISHEALAQPHGAAVTPDGGTVFISNRNTGPAEGHGHDATAEHSGRVVAIDTRTNEVVAVIEAGHYAAGMGGPTLW